jgi:hypothetical protein
MESTVAVQTKGLGFIPSGRELLNGGDEIGHVEKGATANPLVSQLGKPTLNRVQPTATGGHKMRHETRMSFEPGFDLDRGRSCPSPDEAAFDRETRR